MSISAEQSAKSGYQPRPAVVPSAGRVLGLLLLVLGAQSGWLLLPLWLLGMGNSPDHWGLWDTVYSAWTALALPLIGNVVVFAKATRPLWNALRMGERKSLPGAAVAVCIFFHLAQVLLAGLLGLLAVLLGGSGNVLSSLRFERAYQGHAPAT